MASVYDEASRLVVAFMQGKSDQAQVEQQLLELGSSDEAAIMKVFDEKAKIIMDSAGAGHFQRSQRAGSALVMLAVGLDEAVKKSKGKNSKEAWTPKFSRSLMDSVLEMTGAPNRAPKEKAQRAQTASFLTDLGYVGDHTVAKATLLEYAEDKIPAIREKALQGLCHMEQDDSVQARLMACSTDNDKTVRTAAVASMSPSACGRGCLATLLSRLDDTEACVRQALFTTLAREPEAVDHFSPGILARLVVGLHDRSNLVHDAAKKAVPKWVDHIGGPVQLLGKCDLFGDEFLGEDCACQLSEHCRSKSAEQACKWLQSGGTCFPGLEKEAALLARYAIGLMSDDNRDVAVDIPQVLKMVQDALVAASNDNNKDDFLLRQMLHIVAILDFCDEGARRQLARLTLDVLSTAPVSDVSAIPESGNRMKATVHTTIDLGILLLRKCFGFDRNQARKQSQENLISERVMAVIGDIVKVRMDVATQGGDSQDAEPHFTALSRKLEAISEEIGGLDQRKAVAAESKNTAIQSEDFEEAHRCKEVLAVVDAQLQPLKDQHANFLAERDGICHRILAIVSSLLKWTQSDIRKDGVLLGMLTGVVRPILKMKALSEEVNLRALHAIGLFCSIDVELAQNHWDFFSRLVGNLRELQGADAKAKATNLRRAMLAAATLADCARIHGMNGFFDRDQILSAASAVSVVPYESREVAIYPLCGWFMSFGALYFEEHMTNPQAEICWALGWMLTEAFSNKARESDNSAQAAADAEDENSSENLKTQATDLMVFFNILSKHPGRHGEALLCLAVEWIIESGLWRCAVSLPLDAHNQQFTRGFSWPMMFEWVQSRLSPALHLRLWRCCLQVCVTSPALAPWAQIPLALAAGIETAPAGAAELVKTAITLGADADALQPILAGMPRLEGIQVPEQVELLSSRAEAVKAEEAVVAELAELGVRMDEWTPPMTMKAPKGKPALAVDGALRAVAMRNAAKLRRAGTANRLAQAAAQQQQQAPAEMVVPASTPAPIAPAPAIPTPARAGGTARMEKMDVEPEEKPRGMKRLYSKTKSAGNTVEA